jgi:hypothetical protein
MKATFLFVSVCVAGVTIAAATALSQSPSPSPALDHATQKLISSGTASKSQAELPPSMRTPVINRRMERMRLAIIHAAESGKITPGETHSLSGKWEHIRRDLATAEHNHILTPRERTRIHQEITKLADEVYNATHDRSVENQTKNL